MKHPLFETPKYKAFESRCKERGIELSFLREIQSGVQLEAARRSERLIVNVYQGKQGVRMVFQGRGLLKDELARDSAELPPYSAWIGSDESGKGDYFGPLAVAAVGVTRDQAEDLSALGVQDSKTLSDPRVLELDKQIRKSCAASVVTHRPEKYNALYEKLRNLNQILGHGHAEAISGVLDALPECEAAIADKFGDESYIENALRSRGRKIRLFQRPRAESDVAVAAASVVARAAFLRGLGTISKLFGLEFPKGAGPEVPEVARQFIRRHGREALVRAAKLHFKTTLTI